MENDQNKNKSSVSDDSGNATEQTNPSSNEVHRTDEDFDRTEDSSFISEALTTSTELTEGENHNNSRLETPEKEVKIPVSFTASPELRKVAQELKCFAQGMGAKDESFSKTANKESSKLSPSIACPVQEFPTSTESAVPGPEGKGEKYDRNLQKFLEGTESRKEVKLRKKTNASERQTKSDGEMSKIIEYCGDMSNISSILTTNSESSPASPAYNCDVESKQKSRIEKLFGTFESGVKEIRKDSPITEDTASTSATVKKSIPIKMNTSLTKKATDLSLNKFSEVFKVPISPSQKITPGRTNKTKFSSPGTSKLKEDAVTPTNQRPTDFNIKPRKAFYTFSPDCASGVLRQCQSLPNINRPVKKNEIQRRSINFGEHSRIVRSLFKDEPEPPSTPESKFSLTTRSSAMGGEASKGSSREKSSETEVSKALHDRQSKICRKLTFDLPAKEPMEKGQCASEPEAPIGKESPPKRKKISPDTVAECPAIFVKKARTSPDVCSERLDADESTPAVENKNYLKPSCTPRQGSSPLKRKAETDEEGLSQSPTNVIPSKIVSRRSS